MIGPKCNHCKRQLRHHRAKTLACPIGDPRRFDFSESKAFEAKEPKNRASSEKRKDRDVRREIKSQPCCACGTKGSDWNPVDPAHVRTFKVTQSDHPDAMIPLCRECHKFQGGSWSDFLDAYPHVIEILQQKGWAITEHPFQKGKLIFNHPDIK